MIQRASLFVACAAAPFLFAGNVPATRLVFAPAEGATLNKSFEQKTTLTLDSMQISGMPGEGPQMEMDMKFDQAWSVVDEYVKLGDGRPAKLRRTFDKISSKADMSMSMEFMGQSQENSSSMDGKSELEGKTVVWTWDAEKDEYATAFDPEGPDAKLLEELTEDADFRALLPGKEVAEGDEWTIEPKNLTSVFTPCGNLSIKPEEQEEGAAMMGGDSLSSMNELMDALEGEVKAKFAGMREIDGENCAIVELEFKVKSSADLTESVKEQMESSGQELPVELVKVEMEWASEGKGELAWSVKSGHFRRMQFDSEVVLKSEEQMKLDAGGRYMEMTQSRDMSGSSSFVATAK
ncbi:MAG: hypothetical protein RL112_2445 [Planctomycetota bacterium]